MINTITYHSKVLYLGFYLLIKEVRIKVKFVYINAARSVYRSGIVSRLNFLFKYSKNYELINSKS